jgi:aminopeptidase N
MKKLLYALMLLMAFTSCKSETSLIEEGVSKDLAISRFSNISELTYDLDFSIPEAMDSSIEAKVTIGLNLAKREELILDFRHDSAAPLRVLRVNGKDAKYSFRKEHIVIPARYLNEGLNSVEIEFLAGEQSLNRREDLIYTLLVPDRARTLFPCFDQPDLKGRYSLSLTLPEGWVALANGKFLTQVQNRVVFASTEPLPTYLFSFVAGKMNKYDLSRNGRNISIYHRESDPSRIAQCDIIGEQIFSSLEWLEDYTGVAYPFSKYDIAIIPGFQYGGMEHAGATLYSDRTLFTGENPTTSEKLERAKLIAHETAHMWFGDYVTMKWFDDVWTKEVFANWFAIQMVAPMFPEIDHRLSFIDSYFPPAYAEDRTRGSNPVQQELDNLSYAGLVYGNIIYNKAPVVMEMLVEKLGRELFREGIRRYLKKYAYSNATWDDLIEILDSLTGENLLAWSNVWIKEKGRPEITLALINGEIVASQRDPFDRGLIWEQELLNDTGDAGAIIPNIDGKGYGLFILDSVSSAEIMRNISSYSPVKRESVLINLYENMLAGYLKPELFTEGVCAMLERENEMQIFSRAAGFLTSATVLYMRDVRAEGPGRADELLWKIASSPKGGEKSIIAFRALTEIAYDSISAERIYKVWEKPQTLRHISLSERDLTRTAYELALRFPSRYDAIRHYQLGRITGNDRREEFLYLYPSLSPDIQTRDSVFNSLLKAENRGIEPWAASSLGYLNHFSRREQSAKYILPALEILPEIQKTGDIFFPRNWLRALLAGHSRKEAASVVNGFLETEKILHPMLRGKVLQQGDHIINSPNSN